MQTTDPHTNTGLSQALVQDFDGAFNNDSSNRMALGMSSGQPLDECYVSSSNSSGVNASESKCSAWNFTVEEGETSIVTEVRN